MISFDSHNNPEIEIINPFYRWNWYEDYTFWLFSVYHSGLPGHQHPACQAPLPRTSCQGLGLHPGDMSQTQPYTTHLCPHLLFQGHVLNWTCTYQPYVGGTRAYCACPALFCRWSATSGPALVTKPVSPALHSSFLLFLLKVPTILREPLPTWWHTGHQQPQPDGFPFSNHSKKMLLTPRRAREYTWVTAHWTDGPVAWSRGSWCGTGKTCQCILHKIAYLLKTG